MFHVVQTARLSKLVIAPIRNRLYTWVCRPSLQPCLGRDHSLNYIWNKNLSWSRSNHRTLLTLAIETSCDDTAVAVLQKEFSSLSPDDPTSPLPTPPQNNDNAPPKTHLLFNERITAPNTGLGGIHPIQALNSHQANLSGLIARAIEFLPSVTSSTSSPSLSSSSGQPHEAGADSTPPRTFTYNGTVKQLPDFISVTRGPGMRSNLQCGLDTARGLTVAWGVPLVGVHHMQAHALTPRLVHALGNSGWSTGVGTIQSESDFNSVSASNVGSDNCSVLVAETQPQPDFPFLTLLISGGHTLLLHSTSLTTHKTLATTRDIAIGDALDKAGRTILPPSIKTGLNDTAYAKHLSDFAFPNPESYGLWNVSRMRKDEIRKAENEYGWVIQAPLADTRDLAFSFTSISSMVEKIMGRRIRELNDNMGLEERRILGRAALGTAFEHLASRTVIALESLASTKQPVSTLVVSGGVAANAFLRFFLRAMLDVRGFEDVKLVFPPPWLCTDNAAMIGWCGMEMFEAGYRSELGIDAKRKWSMDSEGEDGGILGVGGWVDACW